MSAIEPYDWPNVNRPPGFDWSPDGFCTDCEGRSFTTGATVKLEGPAVAFDDRGYSRGTWESGTIAKISGMSPELNVVFFEGEFEGEFGIEWANGAIPSDRVRVQSEI